MSLKPHFPAGDLQLLCGWTWVNHVKDDLPDPTSRDAPESIIMCKVVQMFPAKFLIIT